MKSYADRKEYFKAYREAHKAERKEYREAHRAEAKAYREAHKAEYKAYREAHRDEIRAKKKAYYAAHKAERDAYAKTYREAHKAEKKAYQKEYKKADTNSNGVTKNCIRTKSRKYLFNVLKHTKLKGYEIHHCFGYDDYRNFIYIPKALHLQIHQYLRDNGIDADTDHYSKIAHLVVAWDGYVYIKA